MNYLLKALIETIAKSITTIDDQFNDGYVLEDFPRNVEQAAKYIFVTYFNKLLNL